MLSIVKTCTRLVRSVQLNTYGNANFLQQTIVHTCPRITTGRCQQRRNTKCSLLRMAAGASPRLNLLSVRFAEARQPCRQLPRWLSPSPLPRTASTSISVLSSCTLMAGATSDSCAARAYLELLNASRAARCQLARVLRGLLGSLDVPGIIFCILASDAYAALAAACVAARVLVKV
jgi:hypothetical protein